MEVEQSLEALNLFVEGPLGLISHIQSVHAEKEWSLGQLLCIL